MSTVLSFKSHKPGKLRPQQLPGQQKACSHLDFSMTSEDLSPVDAAFYSICQIQRKDINCEKKFEHEA